MSFPYAKGWGAEVNLEYIFEKLFVKELGEGYPKHAAASEQRNTALLNKLKSVSHNDLKTILASEDSDVHEMVQATFAGKKLELFKENCQCDAILKAVEKALK